jgi:hypothetical protein
VWPFALHVENVDARTNSTAQNSIGISALVALHDCRVTEAVAECTCRRLLRTVQDHAIVRLAPR